MEPTPARRYREDPRARPLWEELNRRLPANTDEMLFHYTSLDGLIGIVHSGAVWASDSQYLNDPSEGKYARATMIRGAETFGETMPEPAAAMLLQVVDQVCKESSASSVFFTSFSEVGDLLSQWVAYTPDASGVSIGMDGGILSSSHDIVLRKVVYEPAAQQEIIHRILATYLRAAEEMRQYPDMAAFERVSTVAHHVLLVCAVCFKDPAYSAEREWRAIRVYDPDTEAHLAIQYRASRYALIPYIDFRPASHSLNAIREIVIGPGLDCHLNRKSIENICSAGSQPVRITCSRVPFRRVR